jgi:hypothetical protein
VIPLARNLKKKNLWHRRRRRVRSFETLVLSVDHGVKIVSVVQGSTEHAGGRKTSYSSAIRRRNDS